MVRCTSGRTNLLWPLLNLVAVAAALTPPPNVAVLLVVGAPVVVVVPVSGRVTLYVLCGCVDFALFDDVTKRPPQLVCVGARLLKTMSTLWTVVSVVAFFAEPLAALAALPFVLVVATADAVVLT